MATTEKDIVNMGMRIAAAGSQVGLSQAQIMGMAAALSSLGLEAEAGGTAISKLMVEIQTSVETGEGALEDYAEIAGMTAEQFQRAFSEDAAAAMAAFFQGLGNGSQSAILTLQDLGIEEVRLRDTMLRLANSGDLFTNALNLSTTAWSKNTALAEEAGKRYATTESKMQTLKNQAENLKIAIGDRLSPALGNAAEMGTGFLGWLTGVAEQAPGIMDFIIGATVALAGLIATFAGFAIVQKITPMILAFNAALLSNPIVMVAAGVSVAVGIFAALGSALASIPSPAERARESLNLLAQAEEKVSEADNTLALIDRYRELSDKIRDGKGSSEDLAAAQEELRDVKQQLIDLSGGLITATEGETEAFDKQLEAFENMTQAQKESAMQDMLEQLKVFARDYQKMLDGQAQAQEKAAAAQEKYLNIMGDTGVNGAKSLKELRAELEKLKKAEREGTMSTSDLIDAANGLAKEFGKSAGGVYEVNGNLMALEGYLGAAERSAGDLADEWRDSEQEAADYAAIIDEGLAKALSLLENGYVTADGVAAMFGLTTERVTQLLEDQKNAANETGDATAVLSEKSLAAYDSIMGDLDDLEAAYRTAHDAIQETVDGIISGFQEVAPVTKTAVEQVISNLDSQLDYMDTYQNNLQSLLNRDLKLDEGLIAQLSDGSIESAEILAGLVNASDEKILELNEKFKKVEDGKKSFVDVLAETASEFDKKMAEIEERADELVQNLNQSEEAGKSGEATIQSYIDRLEARKNELYDLGYSLGEQVTAGMNAAAGQSGGGGSSGGYQVTGGGITPYSAPMAAPFSYGVEEIAAQAADMAGDAGLMESRIATETAAVSAGIDLSGYAGFSDPAPAVGLGLRQLYQRNVPSGEILTRQGPMEGKTPERVEVSIYLDGALVGKAVTPYVSQNITAQTNQAVRSGRR